MYTIGQISKRFGLSRSTLLYYDSIGLLKPSGRSQPNYRLYSEQDIDKMKQITLYRKMGLPLKIIHQLIDLEKNAIASILENRLEQIHQEMNCLRNQQQLISQLLKQKMAYQHCRVLNKAQWVALLEATGLSEQDMHQWHIEFEKRFPKAHQDFLESLGIPEAEIRNIRAWSKNAFYT